MQDLINGYDYNVTLFTSRFKLEPMTSKDNEELLELCAAEGFSYPYLHYHHDTQHLPLSDRVAAYTALADEVAAGVYGKTMMQSIRRLEDNKLMGAAILFATFKDDALFTTANPKTDYELGAFVAKEHWQENIATEALYTCIKHRLNTDGNTFDLHASMDPARGGSKAIAEGLGLEQVSHIPAGSELVKYNDEFGNPASRNIYRTKGGFDTIRLVN